MRFYRREFALTIFKICFLRSLRLFISNIFTLSVKTLVFFRCNNDVLLRAAPHSGYYFVVCLFVSLLPILNELVYLKKNAYESHVTV